MDTSREFIEMVKTSGIEWEWKIGDWVFDEVIKTFGVVYGIDKGPGFHLVSVADEKQELYEIPIEELIPLPRLDQLAEMMGNRKWSLRQNSSSSIPQYWASVGQPFDSAEKAMLSRVMVDEFGKYWSGSEWVKI
jgi:hypothetical protein